MPTARSISCAHALDSTCFESLIDFSFVHLVLDLFFRFSFVCLLSFIACFLLVLLCLFHWVCHSIFHLMLTNSSIWPFLAFLLCYSYMEECECSWFILLATHWFGNFVGDFLILKVELKWKRNCEEKQSEWLPRGNRSELGLQGVQTFEGRSFGGLDREQIESKLVQFHLQISFCYHIILCNICFQFCSFLSWNGKMHYSNSILWLFVIAS